MTMLPPGGYNFSEKKGNHKKKSMIFVKLTDSAQRALNDFIQDKVKLIYNGINCIFNFYLINVFPYKNSLSQF